MNSNLSMEKNTNGIIEKIFDDSQRSIYREKCELKTIALHISELESFTLP